MNYSDLIEKHVTLLGKRLSDMLKVPVGIVECELRFHFKALNRAIFSGSDIMSAMTHEAGELGVSSNIFYDYVHEAQALYAQKHGI